MTLTQRRKDKDNSIAWDMSPRTKRAVIQEHIDSGWVDRQTFAKLCGVQANGSSFERKCQKADVRNIIVGPHVTGVMRMFKADDASKVKAWMLQIANKKQDVVATARVRNSSGRFSRLKQSAPSNSNDLFLHDRVAKVEQGQETMIAMLKVPLEQQGRSETELAL